LGRWPYKLRVIFQKKKLEVSGDKLPIQGSEDFGYNTRPDGGVPGAFFFLGTKELFQDRLAAPGPEAGGDEVLRSNCLCHNDAYDFNDNVLPRAVMMFHGILAERYINVNFFSSSWCIFDIISLYYVRMRL